MVLLLIGYHLLILDKFALQGEPYSITLYIGDPPREKMFEFSETDSTAVGRVYNFSGGAGAKGIDEEGCSSYKEAQGLVRWLLVRLS